MKWVSLSEAKNTLSALVDEIEQTREPYMVTRYGKPSVVLLHPEVYDELQDALRLQREKGRVVAYVRGPLSANQVAVLMGDLRDTFGDRTIMDVEGDWIVVREPAAENG